VRTFWRAAGDGRHKLDTALTSEQDPRLNTAVAGGNSGHAANEGGSAETLP